MNRYKNILLVEDDSDDQMFFTEAINEIASSASWVITGNGREAIDLLPTLSPPPDLILLDLNMPVMDGFAFLRLIKQDKDYKHIPVVVFSTSRLRMEECYELGALACLRKPNSDEELQNILKDIFISHTLV